MRTTLVLMLVLMGAFNVAAQTPAPFINPTDSQPDLPGNATTDQVLDALDLRGQGLREFTAKVSITEGDPNISVSTRTGLVWFQKKGDSDGRLRITFDKRKEGQIFRDEKVEYLLDNGWLIDRSYRKKTETRRQVLKPGDKLNLLKLGEGPFPLPIGQKKEDVHKLFDVTEIPAGKDQDKDLADTIHLHLKPKPGTTFFRRFGLVDVWVSRKSKFPVKILTDTPDQSDERITKLADVKINPADKLKDADFKLPAVDSAEWSLHTDAYQD